MCHKDNDTNKRVRDFLVRDWTHHVLKFSRRINRIILKKSVAKLFKFKTNIDNAVLYELFILKKLKKYFNTSILKIQNPNFGLNKCKIR